MEIIVNIILLLFLIYLVYILFLKNKGIKKRTELVVPDIPNGYEIYKFVEEYDELDEIEDDDIEEKDEFFVHGVHFRRQNVIEWATGENLKLQPRREAKNKHDPNAIAIYGESSGKKRKIGYIEADVAEDLVYKKLDKKIKLQLLGVEITDDTNPNSDFDIKILVKYRIIVPKTI